MRSLNPLAPHQDWVRSDFDPPPYAMHVICTTRSRLSNFYLVDYSSNPHCFLLLCKKERLKVCQGKDWIWDVKRSKEREESSFAVVLPLINNDCFLAFEVACATKRSHSGFEAWPAVQACASKRTHSGFVPDQLTMLVPSSVNKNH